MYNVIDVLGLVVGWWYIAGHIEQNENMEHKIVNANLS